MISCVLWSYSLSEDDEGSSYRPVVGITVLLSMAKLISYLQALPSFGFLITMMVAIVSGIKFFIILLFAAIFAFGSRRLGERRVVAVFSSQLFFAFLLAIVFVLLLARIFGLGFARLAR